MNEAEFEVFLNSSIDELKEKQNHLTHAYGFGSHKRWMFEIEKTKLQFFNHENELDLDAEIIDIGSYSPVNQTWKWAWAYDTITDKMKADSLRIKELGMITNAEVFDEKEPLAADEYFAWELAAMSVKHLNALGCYRAHSSARNVDMFFAITAVHKIKL